MMDELKEVKRELNPTETLLVVDAMTGQEAAGLHTKYLIFCAFILYSLIISITQAIFIFFLSLFPQVGDGSRISMSYHVPYGCLFGITSRY